MPKTINNIKICKCGRALEYIGSKRMKHNGNNYIYYETFKCPLYKDETDEIMQYYYVGHDMVKEITKKERIDPENFKNHRRMSRPYRKKLDKR